MSDPAPVPASTREALLDAATRLFARYGVFEVSLAHIVRESGQRNASAVHYHFGSRDQLLTAIMEPTVHRLQARRRELLDAAAEHDDPRPVVEAIVGPLVELAREGWRERAWMKIGMELADAMDRVPPELEALLQQAGGTEALELLAARTPPLPPEVWQLRTNTCIGFVSRAAVARARSLDERRRPAMSDEAFVENLIDMFLGALTA